MRVEQHIQLNFQKADIEYVDEINLRRFYEGDGFELLQKNDN